MGGGVDSWLCTSRAASHVLIVLTVSKSQVVLLAVLAVLCLDVRILAHILKCLLRHPPLLPGPLQRGKDGHLTLNTSGGDFFSNPMGGGSMGSGSGAGSSSRGEGGMWALVR